MGEGGRASENVLTVMLRVVVVVVRGGKRGELEWRPIQAAVWGLVWEQGEGGRKEAM